MPDQPGNLPGRDDVTDLGLSEMYSLIQSPVTVVLWADKLF